MANERHTERGFDRLVNFSDAVVAIAITLLVLPLADLVSEAHQVSAEDLVSENIEEFGAFAITFLVTAIFWMVHHRIFELIDDYDTGLLWLSMLWLLFIVLLPFASGVVSVDGFNGGAGVIYAGTMACISLVQGLISAYVRARPALLREGAPVRDLHLWRSVVYTSFFAMIALVSLPWPDIAPFLFWLLIPLGRFLR